MGDFLALLVFAALAAACWYCSVAAYRATFAGPDSTETPIDESVALAAIVAVALTGFIPFPGGFIAGGLVWASATVLTGYLVAASFVERLLVLGVMDMFNI